MKKVFLFTLLLNLPQFFVAQELKQLWEVTDLEAPESVVAYKNHLYVSNVSGQPAEKNGNGFLSKVDMAGKVIELKWLTGFNAPKGLGVYGNHLYVADIDSVALVDLDKGTIEKWYAAKGATFLNDIEIDEKGTVYVTDTFGGNAVYQIKNDQIDLLIKDEQLDYPNGLKLDGDTLYVASWGVVTNPETFETDVPGSLLAVNLSDQSINKVTQPTGNLDGLVQYGDDFIASDWISGKVVRINSNGEVKMLKSLQSGAADINYLEKKNVLLVPQMLAGKLTAFAIK